MARLPVPAVLEAVERAHGAAAARRKTAASSTFPTWAAWAISFRPSSVGAARGGAGRPSPKNQGPKGRGDLIVQIHIAVDRFFRREGLDLIGVVPINLAQALLGSRIKVKTLDDKRVVLRIPPGTQHGQKFRIPGHGIERNGRRGDMYVEAHVTLPEKLSTEEQEAVKSFAEKAGLKY